MNGLKANPGISTTALQALLAKRLRFPGIKVFSCKEHSQPIGFWDIFVGLNDLGRVSSIIPLK